MHGYNHITTFDSQVKQSFTMIVFDTFDELMLLHDVYSLSFSEYIYGSKRVLKTHGRHGGPKKLIGGQVQVFPTSSTRTPRRFWSKERKRSNPTRFGAGFGLQDSSNL